MQAEFIFLTDGKRKVQMKNFFVKNVSKPLKKLLTYL